MKNINLNNYRNTISSISKYELKNITILMSKDVDDPLIIMIIEIMCYLGIT